MQLPGRMQDELLKQPCRTKVSKVKICSEKPFSDSTTGLAEAQNLLPFIILYLATQCLLFLRWDRKCQSVSVLNSESVTGVSVLNSKGVPGVYVEQ